MKITIIGGSQGTGAQLATLAQRAGHEVTTVSRSGLTPPGTHVVVGNANDPAVVTEAIAGAGAVVVTVGAAKGVRKHRAAVTQSVVAAMQKTGSRRIVVQSSLGAGDSAKQLPAFLRPIMTVLLAKPLADHNAQESAVTSAGLDWTLVRPTGLTNKPAAGTWKAFEVTNPARLGGSIPRADLAACLLEILEDDSTIGKALGVSA